MAELNEGPIKTFEADEAIAQHLRVKLDSDGKVTKAGITNKEIGTSHREAFAAADTIGVRLRTAQGSVKMVAAAAIAVGADVFTAAAGKCSVSASTAFLLGTCVTGSSADGDVVEIIRSSHGDTAVI